jgi:hypothetical protein
MTDAGAFSDASGVTTDGAVCAAGQLVCTVPCCSLACQNETGCYPGPTCPPLPSCPR